MVGGAASVLNARRAAALAVVVAVLVAWDAGAGVLPDLGHWADVLVIALLVLPVTFAVPWVALPAATSRFIPHVAVALVALSFLLYLAGFGALFNVSKLLALTAIGYWFMSVFEALSWVVLIALIIPWVDVLSVWRGPTEYIVSEQPSLFDRVSIAFRLPGEEGSANIGPPDILFFSLFLAAAARFELRLHLTWISMVGLLALTLISTNVFDLTGLPALPAIALGFLLPNADLLWKAWRERGLEIRG
ncbi:MAG: hypothetical protein LH654_09045 [Thermoleophilia bacterium]|nr:hypothetical protein [Thermoleophilia bacterium]